MINKTDLRIGNSVVQLLISGTSATTFGNTLLAAGVLKLSK